LALYSIVKSGLGAATGDALTAVSLFTPSQLIANGSYRSYTTTLSALAGNDTLTGWGGPANWGQFATSFPSETLTIANHLNGGDGNDLLISGQRLSGLSPTLAQNYALSETLAGGLGNDTYQLYHTKVAIVELANSGTDQILLTASYLTQALGQNLHSFSLARLPNIERLTLQGVANFDVTGNALANILKGNIGQNRLYGGIGRDFLYGGAGNDSLFGGADNDQIFGGAGQGRLFGDAGNDTLVGGDAADLLYGGAGTDLMQGGAGDDTYVLDSSDDRIIELAFGGNDRAQSALAALYGATYVGVETLQLTGSLDLDLMGGGAVLRMYGNAGRNLIIAGGNNGESLFGGAGNDQIYGATAFSRAELYGGSGDDCFYIYDPQIDHIHEDSGGGYDVVASFTTSLDASQSTGGLDHNIEALQLLGADQLSLTGGGDVRLLTGNLGRNMIYGGTANETIAGGDDIDTLFGGSGADTLIGGVANDEIYGGGGDDCFVFGLIATDGVDYLDDFQSGDSLDLHTAASHFTPGAALITSSADFFLAQAVTLYQIDFDADGSIDLAFLSRNPIALADITAGIS
jgi:Ca2+-binding RTX toxin-like protein